MVSSVSISSDTEYKTGYGFDYLQDIASYTGWSYKYVYGEWNELFDLLEQGSIDVLCGVSYSQARSEMALFSDKPMGTEGYYIYVKSTDSDITSDNFKTLMDKKIGVNGGSDVISESVLLTLFYHQIIIYLSKSPRMSSFGGSIG